MCCVVEMGSGSSRRVVLGPRTYRIERVLGKGAFGKVHAITVSLCDVMNGVIFFFDVVNGECGDV